MPAAAGDAETSKLNVRVLLVDDDPIFRRGLARWFKSANLEVVHAEDAAGALRQLQHSRFNLVITDYRMPGPNGPEVLLAARRKDPELPVIVVSGFSSDAVRHSALQLGARAVLEKPLDMVEFARVCAALLLETMDRPG